MYFFLKEKSKNGNSKFFVCKPKNSILILENNEAYFEECNTYRKIFNLFAFRND